MAAIAGAAGAGDLVLKSGQRVLVQWRANEPWQTRVLIAPVRKADYEEYSGEEAPADAVERVLIWYAMTPDGDIYPHCLLPPAIAGMVPYDATGQPNRALGLGARLARVNPRIYGRQWQLDVKDYLDALEFVTGEDYGVKIRELCLREADLGPPSASRIPNEWVEVDAGLPDPAPDKWVQMGASDGAGRSTLRDLSLDYGLVCSGLAMCKRGDVTFIAKTSSGGDTDLDARVLAVTEDADGGRRLPFRDATRQMTNTEWAKWPLQGPRTALWCAKFISEQDIAPRSRHAKWRSEVNLTSADPTVAEHEFCMRVVQLAVQYDQLNISELAAFELVLRRAQLAEYRLKDRILGSRAGSALGGDVDEDGYLYLGTSETRGMLMIAPTLTSHISEELHREATILKERRKLREERQSNRTRESPAGGGGRGGLSAEAQSKIDRLTAENKKLKEQNAAMAAAPAGAKGAGRGQGSADKS